MQQHEMNQARLNWRDDQKTEVRTKIHARRQVDGWKKILIRHRVRERGGRVRGKRDGEAALEDRAEVA